MKRLDKPISKDMSIKPDIRKGKGRRDLACPQYRECLSYAADNHWPSFNCESCPEYKPRDMNRLIAGKTEKKALKAQTGKLNATVTLDFTGKPEAIKTIKKLANKSGRSPESEVMIMVLVSLMKKDSDFYNLMINRKE